MKMGEIEESISTAGGVPTRHTHKWDEACLGIGPIFTHQSTRLTDRCLPPTLYPGSTEGAQASSASTCDGGHVEHEEHQVEAMYSR